MVLLVLMLLAQSPPAHAATTSPEQLTKDVVVARDRYLKASGSQREQFAAPLRQIVKLRAQTLRTLVASQPGALLQAPLPTEVLESLPTDLQQDQDVERAVHVEGTLEPAAGSTLGPSNPLPYRLRTRQGRVLGLHCVGTPPAVVVQATVTIDGIQLDDELVFRGEQMHVKARTPSDTQAPTVTIRAPRHGEVVHGIAQVLVEASDNQRVKDVTLLKDGASLHTMDTEPYEFRWNTSSEADGPHTLVARASDADFNVSDSPRVIVTVDNPPPRIELKAPSDREAVSGRVLIEAEATDAIGLDSVKFLVDGLAVWVAVSPPYRAAWDTTTAANGSHEVAAVAADRAGNTTTSQAVQVRVLNANHTPVLDPIGSKTVNEGMTLNFIVGAHDPDGTRDPLTFRASGLPAWAQFDPSTHQFIGTPDFTEASQEHPQKTYEGVRFEVCDGQPLCAHEDLTMTVINVNRPPVMEPLGEFSMLEGQPLKISPVVSDPDGDPVPCTVTGAPRWAHFDAATCTLSGTPGPDVASADEPLKRFSGIRFEACDPEHQCAAQTTAIKVQDIVVRPMLERIGDRTINEGESLTLAVRKAGVSEDPVSFETSDLPDGAVFRDENDGTGTFTWTPREDQSGTYAITFTVTNGEQADSETIQLTVRETSLVISGRIVDDIKKVLPGVVVEVSRPNAQSVTAVTDRKGFYLVADLRPGTYMVRPTYTVNSSLPTWTFVHFSPLSRRVDLTTADQRGVNFTAFVHEQRH